MTPTPSKLANFAPGMNNRRPDYRLDAGEDGVFLRNAVNVDVTREGSIKRRRGAALAVPGTDCHSLWADGSDAFFVDGTTLKRLTGTPAAPVSQAVRSGLRPGVPLSYCRLPDGDVAWTDGAVLRRLTAGGDAPLGPPALPAEPVVAASAGGALPAGRYLVCFTQADASGRESPSTRPVQVEVGAGGTIAVSAIPAVARLRIYLSSTNGDQLQRAFTLDSPAPTYSILILPARLGGRCQTLLLADMPPGEQVRVHDGRLLVAAGPVLFYSEPFAPALFDPTRGYVLLPAPISVIEPVDDGVFVVADKTYFLAGDISAAELRTVLPYGALPRSGFSSKDQDAAYWMSDRGLCKGTAGGVVVNVQETNVAVSPGEVGASLVVERDGAKQALASIFGARQTPLVANSFMEAEVIQKGTQL